MINKYTLALILLISSNAFASSYESCAQLKDKINAHSINELESAYNTILSLEERDIKDVKDIKKKKQDLLLASIDPDSLERLIMEKKIILGEAKIRKVIETYLNDVPSSDSKRKTVFDLYVSKHAPSFSEALLIPSKMLIKSFTGKDTVKEKYLTAHSKTLHNLSDDYQLKYPDHAKILADNLVKSLKSRREVKLQRIINLKADLAILLDSRKRAQASYFYSYQLNNTTDASDELPQSRFVSDFVRSCIDRENGISNQAHTDLSRKIKKRTRSKSNFGI